jgi:ribosomal protein S11
MLKTEKKDRTLEYKKYLKKLKELKDLDQQRFVYDRLHSGLFAYFDFLKKKHNSLSSPEGSKRVIISKIKNLLKTRRASLSNFSKNNKILESKEKKRFVLKSQKNSLGKTTRVYLPKIKKIPKYQKEKPILGILYLRRGKRNTYLTLCDSKNRIKASLSAGYIKFKGVKLKSKARKAMYNVKKLAHMLVGLILRSKFNRLHLKFKTRFPKRVKKTFLRILKYKRNKFKIFKLSRYRCKPHNGCRRRKIRRK